MTKNLITDDRTILFMNQILVSFWATIRYQKELEPLFSQNTSLIRLLVSYLNSFSLYL
jgi:hypothetical protein